MTNLKKVTVLPLKHSKLVISGHVVCTYVKSNVPKCTCWFVFHEIYHKHSSETIISLNHILKTVLRKQIRVLSWIWHNNLRNKFYPPNIRITGIERISSSEMFQFQKDCEHLFLSYQVCQKTSIAWNLQHPICSWRVTTWW